MSYLGPGALGGLKTVCLRSHRVEDMLKHRQTSTRKAFGDPDSPAGLKNAPNINSK